MKKILFLLAAVLVIAVQGASAHAHVTLSPRKAVVGRQAYDVRVPNEKNIPTVKLQLLVPDGVTVTGVQQLSGWRHTTKAESGGADDGHGGTLDRITEITWEGGAVQPGEYMVFSFATNYQGDPTELAWKAYQTYSDGSVVPWDDSSENAPAPKVTIAAESDLDAVRGEVAKLAEPKEDEGFTSDANTWIAGLALILGLSGLLIALRHKQ